MIAQIQLEFPRTSRHRRKVRQRIADAAALMRHLRDRGWIIKTVLMAELGWTERRIQDAKEQSRGRIISTSSDGYCLASQATQEKFQHALNEQHKRFRSVERTYLAMCRRFHEHRNTDISEAA